jgi:hypothetical protein
MISKEPLRVNAFLLSPALTSSLRSCPRADRIRRRRLQRQGLQQHRNPPRDGWTVSFRVPWCPCHTALRSVALCCALLRSVALCYAWLGSEADHTLSLQLPWRVLDLIVSPHMCLSPTLSFGTTHRLVRHAHLLNSTPVKHGRPGIGATHSSRFIPLK